MTNRRVPDDELTRFSPFANEIVYRVELEYSWRFGDKFDSLVNCLVLRDPYNRSAGIEDTSEYVWI